jgi:hypothetical protein
MQYAICVKDLHLNLAPMPLYPPSRGQRRQDIRDARAA